MMNVFGGVDTKKYIIETTGTGVAIFDYDNDGWPDIFIVNGTTLEGASGAKAPTNHLYRNNHDGTFTDVTVKAGLAATGWGQGVCVGDYDNDGWDDLYVTYYGKNRLYHNDHGVFKEVSEQGWRRRLRKSLGHRLRFRGLRSRRTSGSDGRQLRGLRSFNRASPGERADCVWKGVPVMCGPRGLPPAKNILYHNLGGGKFEDVTAKAHIDKAAGHYSLSVSTLDYDDDGWPDIYVACDSTPSILYHNNHDGTFTDVAIVAGAAFNEDGRAQAGMGSTVADFNGDGKLDIFRTNFSDDTSTLYRNNGNGTFDDVTFAAGLGLHTQYLGWGTMFFDFDNDGWPDLLVVNGHVYPEVDKQHLGSNFQEPKILYRNNGNGTFTDISAEAGSGITTATSARGLAVGDLWNDGQLSAVISNMNAHPSLLVNQVKSTNHWIAFRTIGTKSNRDGIGARITLTPADVCASTKSAADQATRPAATCECISAWRQTDKIDFVEVRWPSGLQERFTGLPVDSIHELKEGTGNAVPQES